MAYVMKPEQNRQERFVEYADLLKERFASGLLSQLCLSNTDDIYQK